MPKEEGLMYTTRRSFAVGGLAALCAGALRAGAELDAERVLKLDRLALKVGAARPFGALHFSDTHLPLASAADLAAADDDARNLHAARSKALSRSAQAFAASLAYAKRQGLLPLHTGDLLDYLSDANIEAAREGLAGTNTFITPGNHEAMGFPRSATPRTAAACAAAVERLEKAFRDPFLVASRVVQGVNFVAFDNGGLSKFRLKEQLAELKAAFGKGLPVVLLCHFPPYVPALAQFLKERDAKMARSKPDAAYMMCGDKYAAINDFLQSRAELKAVLAGHLHLAWQGELRPGVPLCVAPANSGGRAVEIGFS
ncbi:MAG: metallophosphoesterase [Kiritimatiellae bacterium]|nr:metallophosphoesterase [Kiritimatiellia bacterium]